MKKIIFPLALVAAAAIAFAVEAARKSPAPAKAKSIELCGDDMCCDEFGNPIPFTSAKAPGQKIDVVMKDAAKPIAKK